MATALQRTRDLPTAQRRALCALAGREMRRVLSLWTQTLLPPVLTGVIFLAVFGGALGDRLAVAGVDYVRFLLPGLLVMTVAGQAFANNSTSLFQAKNEGYIEDLLTSPLRPWQLLVGYMAGGLLRAWLAALALWLVAWPFAGAVEHPAQTVLALGLTGLIFAALGVITGMWADTFDQHAFIANVLITPLALVAGVFYPVERLAEPWQTLTYIDPIFLPRRRHPPRLHRPARNLNLGRPRPGRRRRRRRLRPGGRAAAPRLAPEALSVGVQSAM